MTEVIYPHLLSANLGRANVPFLLNLIGGGIEEKSIAPIKAPCESLGPKFPHLIEARIETALLPLANRPLVDTDDGCELPLGYPEDIRANVFDGAHADIDMPFGIISQYAERNLIYSEWHV